MICPACREQAIVVEYKNIELDVCASCKGVWFDADELELLLGSLHLPAEGLVRPLWRKLGEKQRRCPYCRRKMEKALIGPGDGEVIDRCRNGHGLWFDGGELDKVVRALSKAEAGVGVSGDQVKEVGSFLGDLLVAENRKDGKGGQ